MPAPQKVKVTHKSQTLTMKTNEPRHEKMCLWQVATREDSNRSAQLQSLARVLKVRI